MRHGVNLACGSLGFRNDLSGETVGMPGQACGPLRNREPCRNGIMGMLAWSWRHEHPPVVCQLAGLEAVRNCPLGLCALGAEGRLEGGVGDRAPQMAVTDKRRCRRWPGNQETRCAASASSKKRSAPMHGITCGGGACHRPAARPNWGPAPNYASSMPVNHGCGARRAQGAQAAAGQWRLQGASGRQGKGHRQRAQNGRGQKMVVGTMTCTTELAKPQPP